MMEEPAERSNLVRGILLALCLVCLLIGLSTLAHHPVEATKTEPAFLLTLDPSLFKTSKTVSSDSVQPGDVLTYTVVLSNASDSTLSTVLMTDVLPVEVTYAGYKSATIGNVNESNGIITWSNPIAPMQAVTITFTSQVSSGLASTRSFINTADIYSMGNYYYPSATATAVITTNSYLPLIMSNYPPIPTLYSIPAPRFNTYTVTWSAIQQPIDHYVLQESTSSSFGSISGQWELTTNEKVFTKAATQSKYYYRVRVDNASQWGDGNWSNVQAVDTCWFYSDDFSDPNSGWVVAEDANRLYEYKDGEYRLRVQVIKNLFSTINPGAGYQNYAVESDMRWVGGTTSGWYGLVFGVNSKYDQYYALVVVADEQEFGLLRRKKDGQFAVVVNLTESSAIKTGLETNHLGIIRNGNNITIKINGTNLGTWVDSNIVGTTWSGILAGTMLDVPVDARFDNFYLSGCLDTLRANNETTGEIPEAIEQSDSVSIDLW